MGYQVGTICYSTKSEAENAYYSMTPASLQNGMLHQLDWTQNGWQYAGHNISANLPPCSPVDNFNDGALIGWALFGIATALWGMKLIQQRLRT